MQQDVALMEQLLTMNEAVEDLKSCHRGYRRTERDYYRTISSSSKILEEETSPSTESMSSFHFESTNIPGISGSKWIPTQIDDVDENDDFIVSKKSHLNNTKCTERRKETLSNETKKHLERHKTVNDLTKITQKSGFARHKSSVKKANSNDSGYCDSASDSWW